MRQARCTFSGGARLIEKTNRVRERVLVHTRHCLVAVTLAVFACDSPGSQPQTQPASSKRRQASAVGAPRTIAGNDPAAEESARCDSRIAAVLKERGLPGAPGFDAARVQILGQAKADPVVFVRTPEFEPSEDPSVRRYRRTLELAQYPWDVLRWLVPRFVHHPEHGRAALLREGYLYAESPDLAFALTDHVRAHHLFDSDRIWIQRGGRTMWAARGRDGRYTYAGGVDDGSPVKLLLLDRIGSGEPPAPLHRDLRRLRYELHFRGARLVHRSERHLVLDLRYGQDWVRSLLEADGASTRLGCESMPAPVLARVTELRSREARRERALEPIRTAMLAQIEEALPFDEPVTEMGQQDGFLRSAWMFAYLQGRRTFRVNGDRYFVYDSKGRPAPPQVCIDFLYDTFERASGTWWRPLGEKPQRVVGSLDFGTFSDTSLRRADRFIDLARSDAERFEFFEVPVKERIALLRKPAFYTWLEQNADQFEPGDIVMIRGYTSFERPWERRVMHYHSFFIYELDPVSGVPIALVGNPGRPSIRTWQFEGLRTPKRSIWYRVRPRLGWLEDIVVRDERRSELPPTLSAGPS